MHAVAEIFVSRQITISDAQGSSMFPSGSLGESPRNSPTRWESMTGTNSALSRNRHRFRPTLVEVVSTTLWHVKSSRRPVFTSLHTETSRGLPMYHRPGDRVCSPTATSNPGRSQRYPRAVRVANFPRRSSLFSSEDDLAPRPSRMP